MPGIRERLELSDGFSGVFDKYINKLTNAFGKTQDMHESLENMGRIGARTQDTLIAIGERSLTAVGSIENLSAVFMQLSSEADADSEILNSVFDMYIAKMEESEAVWTSAADGLNKRNLMATHSFEELQKKGFIKTAEEADKSSRETEKMGQKSSKIFDGLGKKLTRLGLIFFSMRKMVQYVKNAMDRVPDDVSKPFNDLKDNVSMIFSGVVGKGMEALAGPLQKLTDFINGDQGTKMIAVLEKVGELIGQGIGVALEMVFNLISLVSENFQTMGITASDVFTVVGGIIGGFYSFFYNIVADIYNALAILGEFVVNFLDNPLAAIVRLITDVADWVLGILENIAVAIDKVFGSNIASTLGSWRDTMYNWAEEKIGGKDIKLNRMEKLEYSDVIAKFANAGASFGDSLSQVSYEDTMTSKIKNIDKNTKAIKDSVSKEDLKDIIDMAERRFVNQVNLTAQTPIITINGANTGNSAQDRRLLANAIRDILVEQVAAAPTSPGFAYSGGY